MGKKALLVGIDHYNHHKNLKGAVNDALKVNHALRRNDDHTRNFGIRLLTATSKDDCISRKDLRKQIENLFNDKHQETVLFYFAGHGHLGATGSFLMTSDIEDGEAGVALDEVLTLANASPSKNKIIILDCCHSGNAGTSIDLGGKAILAEGMTVLTASAAEQYAAEINESGVFTTLLVDALNGGGSNLLGQVTPGSIYAHIDQSLGEWQQRPIFKTNVEHFICLKTTKPSIELTDLKRITALFRNKTDAFALNPTYEHISETMIPKHSEEFRVLQRYNRVNLLIPVGAEHMFDAAMQSKSCKLTVLGQHYWNLVHKEII
ncbi:caspase family protein [uncultured Psychroserpens sp.]|uniref:caspase family protein n=1 Tax=uncultured Psychroserpens sp. TaxID=255436 RepID=UPI00261CFA72|nr:caspase family protein [uncultured Psychroserpens sp.]